MLANSSGRGSAIPLPHPTPVFFSVAGVLVTDLHIRASVLQQTEYSGSRATAASVARSELEFPSLSRPLTLRLAGISLAVQQVRLPKVRLRCVFERMGLLVKWLRAG